MRLDDVPYLPQPFRELALLCLSLPFLVFFNQVWKDATSFQLLGMAVVHVQILQLCQGGKDLEVGELGKFDIERCEFGQLGDAWRERGDPQPSQ